MSKGNTKSSTANNLPIRGTRTREDGGRLKCDRNFARALINDHANENNYYYLLGIKEDAAQNDVNEVIRDLKIAYRECEKRYSVDDPDPGAVRLSERALKILDEIQDTLKDPAVRAIYDESIRVPEEMRKKLAEEIEEIQAAFENKAEEIRQAARLAKEQAIAEKKRIKAEEKEKYGAVGYFAKRMFIGRSEAEEQAAILKAEVTNPNMDRKTRQDVRNKELEARKEISKVEKKYDASKMLEGKRDEIKDLIEKNRREAAEIEAQKIAAKQGAEKFEADILNLLKRRTRYEVLGLDQNVDVNVIKEVIKDLNLKYHPDNISKSSGLGLDEMLGMIKGEIRIGDDFSTLNNKQSLKDKKCTKADIEYSAVFQELLAQDGNGANVPNVQLENLMKRYSQTKEGLVASLNKTITGRVVESNNILIDARERRQYDRCIEHPTVMANIRSGAMESGDKYIKEAAELLIKSIRATPDPVQIARDEELKKQELATKQGEVIKRLKQFDDALTSVLISKLGVETTKAEVLEKHMDKDGFISFTVTGKMNPEGEVKFDENTANTISCRYDKKGFRFTNLSDGREFIVNILDKDQLLNSKSYDQAMSQIDSCLDFLNKGARENGVDVEERDAYGVMGHVTKNLNHVTVAELEGRALQEKQQAVAINTPKVEEVIRKLDQEVLRIWKQSHPDQPEEDFYQNHQDKNGVVTLKIVDPTKPADPESVRQCKYSKEGFSWYKNGEIAYSFDVASQIAMDRDVAIFIKQAETSIGLLKDRTVTAEKPSKDLRKDKPVVVNTMETEEERKLRLINEPLLELSSAAVDDIESNRFRPQKKIARVLTSQEVEDEVKTEDSLVTWLRKEYQLNEESLKSSNATKALTAFLILNYKNITGDTRVSNLNNKEYGFQFKYNDKASVKVVVRDGVGEIYTKADDKPETQFKLLSERDLPMQEKVVGIIAANLVELRTGGKDVVWGGLLKTDQDRALAAKANEFIDLRKALGFSVAAAPAVQPQVNVPENTNSSNTEDTSKAKPTVVPPVEVVDEKLHQPLEAFKKPKWLKLIKDASYDEKSDSLITALNQDYKLETSLGSNDPTKAVLAALFINYKNLTPKQIGSREDGDKLGFTFSATGTDAVKSDLQIMFQQDGTVNISRDGNPVDLAVAGTKDGLIALLGSGAEKSHIGKAAGDFSDSVNKGINPPEVELTPLQKLKQQMAVAGAGFKFKATVNAATKSNNSNSKPTSTEETTNSEEVPLGTSTTSQQSNDSSNSSKDVPEEKLTPLQKLKQQMAAEGAGFKFKATVVAATKNNNLNSKPTSTEESNKSQGSQSNNPNAEALEQMRQRKMMSEAVNVLRGSLPKVVNAPTGVGKQFVAERASSVSRATNNNSSESRSSLNSGYTTQQSSYSSLSSLAARNSTGAEKTPVSRFGKVVDKAMQKEGNHPSQVPSNERSASVKSASTTNDSEPKSHKSMREKVLEAQRRAQEEKKAK